MTAAGRRRSGRYTVAFSGARDAYQVPLALFESGQLDRLVTDLYAPRVPLLRGALAEKLRRRRVAGLPITATQLDPTTIWETYFGWRLSRTGSRDSRYRRALKEAQDGLSRAAANRAAKSGSDLFLYAGYAGKAFEDPRLRDRRKVLFMYHPHIALSAEILEQDAAAAGDVGGALDELRADLLDREVDRELHAADLVVCASAFTARTVHHVGVPQEKTVVIPYGIDAPPAMHVARTDSRCRFLFVGSGIHRKGLHLLFDAWRAANLRSAELTVVARSLEPWLEQRLPPGVKLLRGVSDDELERLYWESDVFVLPSLIEGFGYVYLEALARGCHCIGTRNTGLPDLHPGPDEATVIDAGNMEQLREALRATAERCASGALDRDSIRRFAQQWTWSRFREGIATLARREG